MTIDYVRLPVSILRIRDLSFAQKIVLALVASLSKGLKLNNGDIGKILNISSGQASHAITDMERKNYITIKNRQSKYRAIYLAENPKVGAILLSEKTGSKTVLLSGLAHSTSRKSANITKRTKENITKTRDVKSLGDDNPTGNGELFGRFWSEYPKKVGKDAARKAFAKRKPDAELLQTMLEALEWQRRLTQWQKDDGQYIPNPATWLNGGRWKDEQSEPQRGDPNWLPTEAEAEQLMAEVTA